MKVIGPGVERTGLKANEPTHFTVDCTEAGEGKTRITNTVNLSTICCCSSGTVLERNVLMEVADKAVKCVKQE